MPDDRFSLACVITPGIESPTISALQDPEWPAVRVMVLSIEERRIMGRLFALGARGILVTDIQA